MQRPRPFYYADRMQGLDSRALRMVLFQALQIRAVRDFLNRIHSPRVRWDRSVLDGSPLGQRVLRDLRQDGLAVIDTDEFFGAGTFARLRASFQEKLDAFDRSQPAATKPYLERLIDHFTLRDGEVVSEMLLNPLLTVVIAEYLGTVPRLVSLEYWNTLEDEREKRSHSQRWHRDYNDLRMVKLFVYINDVTEKNGAFRYVKGSHFDGPLGRFLYKRAWSTGVRRYPKESELRPYLASMRDAEYACEGRAGTAFLVDTFGFHCGGYCREGTRELFLALYATSVNLYPPKLDVSLDLTNRCDFTKAVLGLY